MRMRGSRFVLERLYPYVFWARTPIDDQMVRWSDGQMYGQMVRYLK